MAPWLTPARIRDDFPNNEGEDQGGKTLSADHCRESNFRVRNRSSDTCPPQACRMLNQNVQGLTGGEKLEKTIKVMIKKGIHGYCLQETWLLGTFSKMIRGHLLLHHGMATKLCYRGRASYGVAIILGTTLLRAWDMAGKPPPTTSSPNSDLPGQMIGVTLCFPNCSNKRADTLPKRGKGRINIFLASIHHPVDHEDQKRFNK